MKVSYTGVKGAFAEEAAKKLYPSATLLPYPSFVKAAKAVEENEANIVVLPIENSTGGEVGETEDLILASPDLLVCKEIALEIDHYLLQRPGDKSKVKKVLSHPQALAQCQNYLIQNDILGMAESNTAVAARKVFEGEAQAAIASRYAADTWNLAITAGPIQDIKGNTTRFWALSKEKPAKNKGQMALVFATENIPGALRRALEPFETHVCNLTRLASRPTRDSDWAYHFIAECPVPKSGPDGLLLDLAKCTTAVRVLGFFN